MTAETSNARGEVGRFRKRPVVIEAVQFDGTVASADRIKDWARKPDGMSAECGRATHGTRCMDLRIDTLEGTMRADAGDWIIRGVQGEFYPCKPEIFAATYEPADAAPPPADAEVRDDDIDDEHSCVAGGPAWQEGFNAGRATGRNEALDELRKAPPEARGVVDGLSPQEIERGWEETFSTTNPFCPCNLKSFTKAVRWAERALTEARNVR